MSKPIYRHYGKVIKGKQVYYNPELKQITLNTLEGQEFEEITKLKTKKVTEDQHGYYRAGIVRECTKYEMFGGWTEDDIDEMFCETFLTIKTVKMLGDKQVPISKTYSTGDIKKDEMKEFIDKCIMWCANNGIVILTSE